MLNREQIQKNCGNMGTRGSFGRERGNKDPHLFTLNTNRTKKTLLESYFFSLGMSETLSRPKDGQRLRLRVHRIDSSSSEVEY